MPAPVGGWNARDALDGMKPTDAIQLDNFFPGTDAVNLRQGSASYATGLGDDVETLIVYASGSSQKMLGIAGGSIFSVTTSGAVGAALTTGLTNSRWQSEMMGGYALMFNGADTPLKYDGTSVTTNSITGSGLTSTNLIYPWVFKHRVFLVEKNTLNAWYLGTDAITGAGSKLDFSTVCQLGGYLVAGGTWTRDGGSGSDDYCVFVTSRGEVLVYEGTDPSDAYSWALVGVFRVGPPVGQRPLLRLGSDLILISIDGFLPLSKQLPLDRVGAEGLAISDKIKNAVNAATRMYGANFGWQAVHYPRGNYALVNVPVRENLESHQYVVNAITGSWCRFTNMNANCWAVYNDNLYFGGAGGEVFQADTGASDLGANIQGDMRPAFNYFGSRGRQKRFTMFRPVTSSDGTVIYTYTLNLDYADNAPSTVATTGTSGSDWDTSDWDTSDWAASSIVQKRWLSATGVGFCASPHIRVASTAVTIAINSIDYVFEPGGIL